MFRFVVCRPTVPLLRLLSEDLAGGKRMKHWVDGNDCSTTNLARRECLLEFFHASISYLRIR